MRTDLGLFFSTKGFLGYVVHSVSYDVTLLDSSPVRSRGCSTDPEDRSGACGTLSPGQQGPRAPLLIQVLWVQAVQKACVNKYMMVPVSQPRPACLGLEISSMRDLLQGSASVLFIQPQPQNRDNSADKEISLEIFQNATGKYWKLVINNSCSIT